MFRTLYLRLLTWARRQTMIRFRRWLNQRRARQRIAELERRIIAHDHDTLGMSHFPGPIIERMAEYRKRLVAQLDNARRFT